MPTSTAMQPLPSKPNELNIFLWVVKGYVDKNKDHDNFVSRTFRLRFQRRRTLVSVVSAGTDFFFVGRRLRCSMNRN
jgi:hypothetical protein